MQLTELQDQAATVFLNNLKRDNIEQTNDYLVMKLSEELGEFVQSYLVHAKRCRPEKYLPEEESKRELSKELADVLGIALVIAKTMEIDVEEALVKKWITREWLKK
ncbi:MAG: MazG nucleotide pyrophosphohydrolase domain-containing protein [Patescibacteria group bacterium]